MKQLIRCTEPGAPLCYKNGKLDVIRTSPSGNTVFVQVLLNQDGAMVPAPGAYLVLPVKCYRADQNMPFDFLREVNWHKAQSGMTFDNGGFNYTTPGGATFEHAHYWLMLVQPGDEAFGLYGLRGKYRTIVRSLAEANRKLSLRRSGW